MIIISAMSRTGVIGVGDGMPWDIPDEYQHFLDTTRDQALIIGRRSFEIFGPTLTCRDCFVISRGLSHTTGATVVSSLNDALAAARLTGREIFVAGGASIYAEAVPLADRMLLSYIEGDFAGDAYFPTFDESDWNVYSREHHGAWELVDFRRSDANA